MVNSCGRECQFDVRIEINFCHASQRGKFPVLERRAEGGPGAPSPLFSRNPMFMRVKMSMFAKIVGKI